MPTSLRWHREIWWFVLPLAWCPLVALVRPGDAGQALARAEQLLDWQRSIGVLVEPSVHDWVAGRPVLRRVVDVFYLTAHLSALIATGCWLAVRRRRSYVGFRRTFAIAQSLTAVVYLLWPVAPLRMVISDGGGAAGPAWTRSVQYEFAAMPSGHVVFALVVGLALWRHAPGCWRWLGVAHPLLTVASVVATAHHLLADAVAAAAVTGTAIGLSHLRSRSSHPLSPVDDLPSPTAPSRGSTRDAGVAVSRG